MPLFRAAQSFHRRRAIFIGLLLASVSVLPTHAFESVQRGAKHFFECLGMMIGDPPTHSDNCLPNRVPGPFGSIEGPSAGGAPPVVVSPPPPVVVVVTPPPPPPPAPDPCACGACYAV